MSCATSDWYVVDDEGPRVERYTVLKLADTLDRLRLSRCSCGRSFVDDPRTPGKGCGHCGST